MRAWSRAILMFVCCIAFAAVSQNTYAQFKKDAFTQDYGEQEGAQTDSTGSLISIKEYFRGITHKDKARIGTLAVGSTICVGGMQIYNRDYWKLPIIYGGIAAGAGSGIYFLNKGNKSAATASFAAAGLVYYASFMDGTINYHRDDPKHHPGRATLYSVLCPGLGQIYNGEAWKIPIYWGCLLGAGHFLAVNNKNYVRFKRIHNEASSGDGTYTESISESTALYYRDVYRRYRDYSIVALAGFYLLQAIDANVFAFMTDFEVSDDISMRVAPSVILPENNQYAFNPMPAYGMSIGFRF